MALPRSSRIYKRSPPGGQLRCVCDGTARQRRFLYLNRAEVARTAGMTLTPASLGSTTNNWIGRSQYAADPYLDGIVDDIRVHKRALSAGEIAALP